MLKELPDEVALLIQHAAALGTRAIERLHQALAERLVEVVYQLGPPLFVQHLVIGRLVHLYGLGYGYLTEVDKLPQHRPEFSMQECGHVIRVFLDCDLK